MANAKLELIQPKSKFDRMLARLAQQKVWDFTPQAVDMQVSICNRMLEIANDEECPKKTQLIALREASKLINDTVISRTIPALLRVQSRDMIAGLPLPEGVTEDPKDDKDREILETNRQLVELLQAYLSTQALNGSRPGLVLIEGGGDVAAH